MYAHDLIDSGADVILGHHSHVIQEIEEYNNGIICYSLGNFISDMVWNPRTREGLSVKITFRNGDNVLENIKKVRIGHDYSPSFYHFSYSDLTSYVDKDVKKSKTRITYLTYLKRLIKDNRNLGHIHLLLNFFRYSPITYLKIWMNSMRSLLNI